MSFFLFPGQGSQRLGMGEDFHAHSPAAREIFDRAAALLPDGFLDSVFRGDEERLNQTRMAQPALLVVETAIARHLEAQGVPIAGCAGHSLGEIPALVVAGACAFEDAVRFTQERARLMSENVPEGGMAAVMGLSPDVIDAALPEGAQVANYNTPDQTIITGHSDALAAAHDALKAAGAKRIIPLKVSGPFHSQYMRPAAEQFRGFLAEVPFQAPRVRFISSVSGQEESDPERIRMLLFEQLFRPVRWTQAMRCAGRVPALEIGPGGVLRGLTKRFDGAPQTTCVSSIEEAEAAILASKESAHGTL
jgi:[acyl-carrier-protein] S-malonyltransferase